MDVIEALDHLDKMDEEEDTSFQSTKRRKMKEYLDKKLIPLCICFFITAMVGITAMLINMSTLKVSVVVDDDDPVTVKQIGTLTTAEALHLSLIHIYSYNHLCFFILLYHNKLTVSKILLK